MSVVIVGEVDNDLRRLQLYFKRMNITEIHSFQTVESAIEYMSNAIKETVELVILDVKMTLKNCEGICQKIDLLHKWIDVPILLSTTYEKAETIDRVFESGVFDFILKPFDFLHFKSRILVALKFIKESKQRKRREEQRYNDLIFAKKVQKNALSPRLVRKHVECDGLYLTSNILGGDMYCWFKIDEHLTAVLLYDVMGHGIAASLVTMSIRSLTRGLITRLVDPVTVMKEMNRQIYTMFTDSEIDHFLVTAIYLLIDTKNKTVEYVNAAHPAGIKIGKYKQTMELAANAPILGLLPNMKINKKKIYLADWSRIILYTDGLLLTQQNEKLDTEFFHSYASQHNTYTLNKFAEQYNLYENTYKDDISMVSITITLEGG
ncbi:SpoIIE family protein phosphatase [Lysinibacillus sp. KU-BSD001]|uniref:SpoIIE family protein phosphatase n=1 Tax=Lysinibacillus sp. KU-BSD001 TaxID=3141328 RepID=UPI0036E1B63A